ncbi:MAG: hypothetical protein IT262_07385 [Saprospiraceae bacterium]|nr:hypothetical protein [Saprospiraceae bacterium]
MKSNLLAFLLVWAVFAQLPAQDISALGKQKPVDFSGSLQAGVSFYNARGVDNRRSPFIWTLSGSPVLSLYGFQLPFTVMLSDRQLDYNTPVFRRIGVSPYWKWIKLHGGYRNMQFSPYSLNGLTFLGGGIELTPGKLRFAAMYGKMEPLPVTPTLELTGYQQPIDMYRRKGMGLKLGVGTASNFFDLIFFKAKDDGLTGSRDSLLRLGITPAENLVVGTSFKLTFFRKLSFAVNAAASGITKDQNAPPADLTDAFARKQKIIKINQSSYYYFAGDAQIGLRFRHFNIGGSYQRIDPGYTSFGVYFINQDVENLTGNFGLNLLQGKLSFNARYGKQRNNLYKRSEYTSLRDIMSADFSLTASKKFSVSGGYSNFSLQQQAGLIQINDTFRLASVNANAYLSPQLTIVRKAITHTISLNISYDQYRDQNPFSNAFTDTEAQNASANYRVRWKPSGLMLSAGLFASRFHYPNREVERIGLSTGAGKEMFAKKLNLRWTGNSSLNRTDGQSDGFLLSNSISLNYKVTRKMSLGFGLSYLNRRTKIQQPFNELRSNLNYSLRF